MMKKRKILHFNIFWHSDFLYFPEPSGNFSKNSHNRDGFFFPPWDIIVPPANTRNSSCLPDCLQKSTTSRENPWLQSGGRCVCVCWGDVQTARDTATCDRNRGTKKDGWNTAVLMRCGNTAGHWNQATNLRTHVEAIHEGVRYSCDQCGYKATTAGNLKKHIDSIHTGVCYPCDQCDYKATVTGSLKKHVESTHEGVRYPCDQCDYKATTKGSLKRHQKRKHQWYQLALHINWANN